MSPLLLAALALLALNVLLIAVRAWRGRDTPRRALSREELIEIHDEWEWPVR